ncbi:MAG TPA: GAF domain-containing protein [Aldersonia sp.]
MAAHESGPSAELLNWLSCLRTLSAAATSGGGLREVLGLVAETARSLLGFDFCGVLTPDADGKSLLITGWNGLSDEYVARINADRPVGLDSTSPSARAFHDGRPVSIRDITAEPMFTPWGGVAREQGYRAIVSVPLVAGGQVLGTLNGYFTPVHTFTEYEIERMSLLANHAAIALVSARRLDELSRLTESLRAQRDVLARSEQIHERLLDVTLRAGGLDGILAVLAELIARPVLVEDARGMLLAQAGDSAAFPDSGWRLAAAPSGASAKPIAVQEGTQSFWVSVVRLAGEVVARIWYSGEDGALDPLGERAVEHAALVISLELFRLRTGVEVEHRLRGELLAELLTTGADVSDQILRRAERLGHDLTRPHLAIVGSLGATDEDTSASAYQRALTAVTNLARPYLPRPLAAMYRGRIVVLWPSDADRESVAAEHVRSAMNATPAAAATVAVSAPGQHDTYARAYRTARGALDIALRAGRTNTVVTLGDLGISGLLLQLDDPAQLLSFADRTLSPLIEYDRAHRTELLETLRVHLARRLSGPDTAGALHIHPNTVKQRLRRIEQLTGSELADPATVVQFGAALTVRDVAAEF